MAVCLKCDNCNAVATENDIELPRWWTVERYGSEWIGDPGRPTQPSGQMIMMPAIMMSGGIEVEDSEEFEEAMMTEFLEDSQGIAVGLTLHFCQAACMAAWSTEAAAFEI